MASKISVILSLLVIAILAVDASSSSHNGPSPSNSADCSSLVVTLADCLSFVTNGSTITKPTGQCCSGLKTVLKNSPSCLCEVFKSSSQLGVALNVTKALTLPDACNLSAPPLSKCGLSEGPAAAAAPGGSLSPKTSPTPAPVITAEAPSPKSGASPLLPISAGSLLVCIFYVFAGL